MKLSEFLKQIVFSPRIENKLLKPSIITEYDYDNLGNQDGLVLEPARSLNCKFSNARYKFPKSSSFHLKEKRGEALHYFANHELLAIEIMAAALLRFKIQDNCKESIIKGVLNSIEDEQKHFQLYNRKMIEYGINFGEIPLNDYFWRQFLKTKSIFEYFALMSLTFEAANLDFCSHYIKIFKNIGDTGIVKILENVYADEISHVGLGAHWLNYSKGHKDMWSYYNELLPNEVTPSRAKGINFDVSHRLKSGLDIHFSNSLKNYRDPFDIVERKSNK